MCNAHAQKEMTSKKIWELHRCVCRCSLVPKPCHTPVKISGLVPTAHARIISQKSWENCELLCHIHTLYQSS